jgi:hypothetical protein
LKLLFLINYLFKKAANESADGQTDLEAKKPTKSNNKNSLPTNQKYISVEDYGDSIIEKLNDGFTKAIDKVC